MELHPLQKFHMSDHRIGMLLVHRGAMSVAQVNQVLNHQQQVDQPFGKLARDMFGIDERDIASAWAEQVGYICQHVDLACEPNDPGLLDLVTAADAWSAHVLPLRYEKHLLVAATTVTDLPNALRKLLPHLDHDPRFVIAERRQLERYIIERYGIVSVERAG